MIKNGVTSLNEGIFADLTSLENVDFGSVKEIAPMGGDCFGGSSVKNLILPETLTMMSDWALSGCKQLETVVFPEGPMGVTQNCFAWCENLKSVTFGKDVVLQGNLLANEFGVSCNEDVVYYGYSGSSAEENALEYGIVFRSLGLAEAPSGKCGAKVQWSFDMEKQLLILSGTGETYHYLGHCEKPEQDRESLITDRGIDKKLIFDEKPPWYKYRNKIREVVIEEGVTALTQELFKGMENLQTVDFGKVTAIGTERFAGCNSLKEIILPDTVESIDENMFLGDSQLEKVTIPNASDHIGGGCFDACTNLKTVILGERANPKDDLLNYNGKADTAKDVVYHVYKDSPAYHHAIVYDVPYKLIK